MDLKMKTSVNAGVPVQFYRGGRIESFAELLNICNAAWQGQINSSFHLIKDPKGNFATRISPFKGYS